MNRKNQKGNNDSCWEPWKNLIILFTFVLSIFTFFQHGCEIENLKKLNKQHINPDLMLMINGNSDGSNTITVKNTEILPAVEIYIRRNIYYYSKDAKKICAVESEEDGWHISELTPGEVKTKVISPEEIKLIIENSTRLPKSSKINGEIEPVLEFCAEFHRQSDLKSYSFKQMYFLKDSNLRWSEDSYFKNDPYYANLYKLVRNYKNRYKNFFPKFKDMGKY